MNKQIEAEMNLAAPDQLLRMKTGAG